VLYIVTAPLSAVLGSITLTACDNTGGGEDERSMYIRQVNYKHDTSLPVLLHYHHRFQYVQQNAIFNYLSL